MDNDFDLESVLESTPVTPSGTAYVDVRGTWPVLHDGMFAIVLENQPRDISVAEALVLVGR